MKRIIVDIKTKTVKEVEDGLPFPDYSTFTEDEGLDLAKARTEIADLKARVEKLEKI